MAKAYASPYQRLVSRPRRPTVVYQDEDFIFGRQESLPEHPSTRQAWAQARSVNGEQPMRRAAAFRLSGVPLFPFFFIEHFLREKQKARGRRATAWQPPISGSSVSIPFMYYALKVMNPRPP
jgi:hypothetical protein